MPGIRLAGTPGIRLAGYPCTNRGLGQNFRPQAATPQVPGRQGFPSSNRVILPVPAGVPPLEHWFYTSIMSRYFRVFVVLKLYLRYKFVLLPEITRMKENTKNHRNAGWSAIHCSLLRYPGGNPARRNLQGGRKTPTSGPIGWGAGTRFAWYRRLSRGLTNG